MTDRITEELDRYKAAGYDSPDYIYLGSSEHLELSRQARLFSATWDCKDDTYSRLKFRGREVYLVDQLNFIGFGQAQPSPCG